MLSRLLLSLILVFGIGFAHAGQAPKEAGATLVKAVATQPVNINIANVKELRALKGIGAKRAQAIIDYRDKNGEFKTINDLTKVKGISEKFLDRLQKKNPGLIAVK